MFFRVRLNVKPRNQLPLADVSRLNPRSDAFDLTSVFRDGDMHISFGKPGRPGGDVGNVYLQVTYGLSTILAGELDKPDTLINRSDHSH